jgi:CheY-like chemotaxis protein
MDEDAHQQQRRHDRAEVDGCALVHAPAHPVRCRIVNLSLGGMLVRASDPPAELVPGVPVVVELELDELGWASQAGEVIRRDGTLIAIRFAAVTDELSRVIEGEVREASEAVRTPRVVVVDPSPDRRRRVVDALREAGARSFEAATPLEAVDLLEKARVRVAAIAVADTMPTQTASDELVGYLAEHHPDLRVALIGEHAGMRNPRALTTLPMDEHADLRGPVRALLAR